MTAVLRSAAGRAFQDAGPEVLKARGPRVTVCVRYPPSPPLHVLPLASPGHPRVCTARYEAMAAKDFRHHRHCASQNLCQRQTNQRRVSQHLHVCIVVSSNSETVCRINDY